VPLSSQEKKSERKEEKRIKISKNFFIFSF